MVSVPPAAGVVVSPVPAVSSGFAVPPQAVRVSAAPRATATRGMLRRIGVVSKRLVVTARAPEAAPVGPVAATLAPELPILQLVAVTFRYRSRAARRTTCSQGGTGVVYAAARAHPSEGSGRPGRRQHGNRLPSPQRQARSRIGDPQGCPVGPRRAGLRPAGEAPDAFGGPGRVDRPRAGQPGVPGAGPGD